MMSDIFRIGFPALVGVAGSLYSYFLRGHPWEAALAVGLAIATLTFAALRARERLQRLHRQSRTPWEREE